MIDASIISGLKPFQVESPVDNYSKMMTLQDLMQKSQMGQMNMQDRQRAQASDNTLAQLLSQGKSPADVASGLASAGYGEQSMAYSKSQQEIAKGQANITHLGAQSGKLQGETLDLAIARHKNELNSVNTPEAAAQWVKNGYADPSMADLTKHGNMEQALAGIPSDPAGFAQWKMQNSLKADEMIKMTTPDANARLTAQTSTENSVRTAASSKYSADSSAGSAAANRKQAESHFQAGQSTPQYMETDAGLVALPKKLAPGQVPTGTPVTSADGQPLGKPLKAIPATVNAAIIQNSQSTGQIDRALKLLGGADTDGMKGDKAATGWKGYLPNGVLNRVDPQGVDARALVSDIGSLKIHDRSGAAVTISESPRLMPFIPLSTDDAVTVKKKLNKLRVELSSESAAMQEVYSKDQGYRPSPVKVAPAAANVDAAHAQVMNDNDYNALASGASFIGPDGKTRRKP